MDDGCWLFEPKSASPSVLGSTKMTNDEHPPLFGRDHPENLLAPRPLRAMRFC